MQFPLQNPLLTVPYLPFATQNNHFRAIFDSLQPPLGFALCQFNELTASPVLITAFPHRNLNIIHIFLLKSSLKLNPFSFMGSGK